MKQLYLQLYRNTLQNYTSKTEHHKKYSKIMVGIMVSPKTIFLPVNIIFHFRQVRMFDLNFASSDFFLPNAWIKINY